MQMTPPRVVAAAVVLTGGALMAMSAVPETSWFHQAQVFIFEQQRTFSRDLAAGVRALRDAEGWEALLSLTGLGFLYGVFHAAGPGHGKAVIATYSLTQDSHVKRTVGMAFGAALVQGLSAILIVLAAALVVGGGLRQFTRSADGVAEVLSYGAVLGVGLYLALRGLRQIRAASRNAPLHSHDHHGDCGCGHAHAPTPDQTASADTWYHAAMISVAVGLRPCSGAILVLVLTFSLGQIGGGIATVLAMSLGTALTVSALVLAAQGARIPLIRLLAGRADESGSGHAVIALGAVMVLGGLVISALGGSLLVESLNTTRHPFF